VAEVTWYARNAERHKEINRLWRLRNPAKLREIKRRAYLKGREKAKEWRKSYAERERALARARNANSGDAYLSRRHSYRWIRAKLIEAYGSKCVRCGFDDSRALQIDHVNGGGSKEQRMLGAYHMAKKQLAEVGSGEYQLLCATAVAPNAV
jgi:hypothetical protein